MLRMRSVISCAYVKQRLDIKDSCRKVMFSLASVCQSTVGGGWHDMHHTIGHTVRVPLYTTPSGHRTCLNFFTWDPYPTLLLTFNGSHRNTYSWIPGGTHPTRKLSCYRPHSEAIEGYVFTGICLSKSRGGGGGGQHQWSTTSPPGPGQNIYPLPLPPHPQDKVRTSIPPRTRSEHLPPPPSWDQVRTSTPSPPGPGQNIYPLPPETTRRRAVRILLECILVSKWL